MAAHAVTARGSGAHHGRSSTSTSSLSYPPAPPSPTLTNPDMILPDYDRSDSPDDRSQSPVMLWNNAQFSDLQFHLPSQQNSFVAGPMTPPTPIIYGNGTMLSDIGEVTEVESTVGRMSRRAASRLSNGSDDELVMPTSPTVRASRIKTRSQIMARVRKSSIDSTSTITTQGQGAPFADFDDSVSVGDSSFQGDDEESMASSYVDGTPAQEPAYRARPALQQRRSEDRYSSNSLSQRAEEILANAKRRLTTMEGNLSRARSSLSQSSLSDGSTPSPPMLQPVTATRESSLSTVAHSRNLSETGILNGMRSPTFPQRSASALGAAGGYRQPLTSSKSADAIGRKLPPLDTTIEQSEDENEAFDVNNQRSSAQNQPLLSPTFGSYMEKGLTRSASVAQMRDLKDQMKDLKGKISSLKEQAREDSMKRQSLQSLRTPSPFTHARWEQGHVDPHAVKSPELGNGLLQPPLDRETPVVTYDGEIFVGRSEDKELVGEDQQSEMNEFEEAPEQIEHRLSTPGLGIVQPLDAHLEQPTDIDSDGMRTENGDVDVDVDKQNWAQAEEQLAKHEEEADTDDNAGYESESGESLYLDTVQHPVSHEDREDAFDYEHFFLHSAMGTLSQQRLGRRNSSGSLSSEDSVETTKGPMTSRARRPSVDTIASFDSFATATEGQSSRSSTSQEKRSSEAVVLMNDTLSGPQTVRQVPSETSSSGRSNSAATHHDPPRRGSVVHRPSSNSAVGFHRPSVSSLGSTGTNRSFPLVNKAKMHGGILTPGVSPDHELKQISDILLNDAASFYDQDGVHSGQREAMQMLCKEDQILVERVVASLGRCVLGLGEGSRASSESRTYRRRMEAARRILEGLDD